MLDIPEISPAEDFPDIPEEDMLVDTPSRGITGEPSEVPSDNESDFSEVQPEDYLIPDNVESEFSEYLSDEKTQTPVYLSVETKEKLEEWEMKNIIISKVVAKHKPTKKRVQTQITGPIEELLNEYANPTDTPPKGSISTVDLPDAPKSRKAMLLHPYRDYFLAAEKVELNAMNRKCIWKGGKYVKGRKLLRPKWIYSYKVDLDTKTVSRFKARLV
ncbi:hypothetical protein HDU78_010492, partial [Chytriomyces hyalinus]